MHTIIQLISNQLKYKGRKKNNFGWMYSVKISIIQTLTEYNQVVQGKVLCLNQTVFMKIFFFDTL